MSQLEAFLGLAIIKDLKLYEWNMYLNEICTYEERKAIMISNAGKRIVVSQKAAESALRGAAIFVPGKYQSNFCLSIYQGWVSLTYHNIL